MELNLKRPLLFFDIESTGLNIASDCIAELSFVKILPGGEQRIKTWRVRPWDYVNNCQKPMNPSAQAVHGISDEELADKPRFFEILPEVCEWLSDSDLAGYNSAKFDLPLLAEEIERARAAVPGLAVDIDLHQKKMVDVQVIYHKNEPRNLKAAYNFYVGGDFENAHAAEADTLATYAVLKGQLDKYPEEVIKNDVDWLANYTENQKVVDYAGRIVLNAEKEPCISFGKHKGKTCREVYMTEPSYFAWISNGDFTLDTKRQFALLKEKYDAEKKAARTRPLSEQQMSDAAAQLRGKWGGTGRSGSLF
ncbi:MAG: 3'-5' exonuclease [Bacteroidales bacterium]|nr:3'-5' exonuclease [Bacteroidales bacterium]